MSHPPQVQSRLGAILRATSGLPFSFNDPGWTTDWQQSSNAVVTGKVVNQRYFDQNGNPQYFKNITDIVNGVNTGGPIRLSYPGENGERNNFRADGIFDLDSGLPARRPPFLASGAKAHASGCPVRGAASQSR